MTAGLDNLKHIVVLMMENRSFDHMLGSLMQKNRKIAIPSRAQTSGMSGTVKVQHRPLASAGGVGISPERGRKQDGEPMGHGQRRGRKSLAAVAALPHYAVIVRYQGKIIYQAKIQSNTREGQQTWHGRSGEIMREGWKWVARAFFG
jgi:Phosphoesterase family